MSLASRITRAAILATAGVLLAVAPVAAQLEGGPTVGEPAPRVTTTDLDGRPVDLGQWLGKGPVFIEFWATWCETCRALKPRVDSAFAQYGDRVTFLGVDVAFNETVPGIRDWLAEHRPGFKVLYDSSAAAVRAYDVQATSTIYIVGRDGRVAYAGVGAAQELSAALARIVGSDPPSRGN